MWSVLISDLAVKGRKQKMGHLKICFLFKMKEVLDADGQSHLYFYFIYLFIFRL